MEVDVGSLGATTIILNTQQTRGEQQRNQLVSTMYPTPWTPVDAGIQDANAEPTTQEVTVP